MKYILLTILFFSQISLAAYKLEIKKGDGSTYWIEHSSIQGFLEKWVAEEQTRPYWQQNFTYSITEE